MSISGINGNDRREICIQTTNQENTSPSESIFNLNDYYNQGYKSDEQNQQEAEVMQNDLLTLYDIDPADPDKDEKLLLILDQMVNDSNNSPLHSYCEANGIPTEYNDDNAEEFIQGVSTAMAHMSHDRKSDGDEITLRDVDFSSLTDDLADNEATGYIETKATGNGTDRIVYGSNNEVLKVISETTDNNGLTTLTAYSDAGKSKALYSETCIKFDTKNPNEPKYKFASGNQYTIDFTDNGNSLDVSLSRASLNKNIRVEKNSDGTYNLNGKQYYSMDELAVDLNKVQIDESPIADGNIDVSRQGYGVNDCGLLSGINSLSYTKIGKEAIKNALTYNNDGSITVNLKGVGKSYNITAKELNDGKYSKGDTDVKAIEKAVEKVHKELMSGKLEFNYSDQCTPQWILRPDFLSNQKNPIASTFPQEVFYLLTGKDVSNNYYPLAYEKTAWFEQMENTGDIAIAAGVLETDGTTVLRGNSTVKGKSAKDAFGNDVKFVSQHAYAVKDSAKKPNGERVITVVNPYDSSEEIVLNESTFWQVFGTAFAVDLSDNNDLNNKYYKETAV